jgi:dipeptidase E
VTTPPSLLLISTSTVHGTGYLEHARAELRDVLGSRRSVAFIPYALRDHDGYAAKARDAFADLGFSLRSVHEAGPAQVLEDAEAVFVGGGNTFRLLRAVRDRGLVDLLRRRVAEGLVYTGASAGANLACPTIMTTNDMPIVPLPSFEALGLVRFQINPHYLDPDPASKHMGETRETRIREFLEENDAPVIGLREGSMLRVTGDEVALRGIAGGRIFRRGQAPVEVSPGDILRL